MRSIELGSSGIEVTEFCLGTMYFGSRVDKETSLALMDQYMDAGGNFFDTANAYARWVPGCQGGESEAVVSEWLRTRGRRNDVVIATKVGMQAPVDGLEFGLRAAQIEAACEASLKRLGVDTIDLYYAHADDRSVPLEETLEAFSRLVQAGKVRSIGASNYTAWRLEQVRALAGIGPDFCALQQRFSYLRPRRGVTYDPHVTVDEDMLDYLRTRDLTLLAYSPLLGGVYAGSDPEIPEEYRGEDTDARLQALHQVATETGLSPVQLVLAWLVLSDPPTIPLIAASSAGHMRELLDAADANVDPELLERLSMAGTVLSSHPNAQRHPPRGAKRG
jgi:aryl-alcohol dehydrogenase-like predicted oxidoreductase